MKSIFSVVILSAITVSSFAQIRHESRYPSPQSATYDNNGNDLRGFMNATKNELMMRGGAVNDASGNNWGYLQVKNVKIPSQDKKGNLNYYQAFDATLAVYKTRTSAQSTWWAREYNSPKGAMIYIKADEPGMLSIENVRYNTIINELNTKAFTLVEYYDSLVTSKDFDLLLKNTLLVKSGTVKDVADYKEVVDFCNGFLGKFTSVDDPLLDNKSFLCFFTAGKNKYLAYFNIINGKLSGMLVNADAQYEADKISFINEVFRHLSGSYIHTYGKIDADIDRMIRKRAEKSNLKVEYKAVSSTKKFNDD